MFCWSSSMLLDSRRILCDCVIRLIIFNTTSDKGFIWCFGWDMGLDQDIQRTLWYSIRAVSSISVRFTRFLTTLGSTYRNFQYHLVLTTPEVSSWCPPLLNPSNSKTQLKSCQYSLSKPFATCPIRLVISSMIYKSFSDPSYPDFRFSFSIFFPALPCLSTFPTDSYFHFFIYIYRLHPPLGFVPST